MIPVLLTIKGLYSYIKAETIDFDPLVSAKLFGIFGPVGSGKSAILEAIMFVLFDRTTRLNKVGDDRYYNMMNLQSNETVIDFIFKGGAKNQTKYRFYFMARRSAKDFKKVEVKDRSYYKWSKNEWLPLNKPEGLGMTYDNFMQTVIIPQGKFRDFIDQKPKDRTQMLKELFHLDRFDIAAKAFGKLGTIKEQYQFLEGQLSQFQHISKVLIKQLEKEISTLTSNHDRLTKKEEKLNTKLRDMQLLQHQYHELEEISRSLSVLESEATFFKNKQAQLSKYLKVQDLFKDKIAQQHQLLMRAKTKEQELTELIASVDLMEKEVVNARADWEKAEITYSEREEILRQVDELAILVRLKTHSDRFEIASNILNNTRKANDSLRQEVARIDNEITKLQTAAVERSKAISSIRELSIVNDWWETLYQNRSELELLKNEQAQLEKTIKGYEAKKSEINSRIVDQSKLKQQIVHAKQAAQDLKLQVDWSQHAQHLEEGKPCPLCGATSHPQPITHKGLDQQYEKSLRLVSKLESDLEAQRKLKQDLEIISVQLKAKSDVLADHQNKCRDLDQEINKLVETYPEGKPPDRKPSKLKSQIASAQKVIDTTEKTSVQLDTSMRRRQELVAEQAEHQQTLERAALDKEKLQGKIDELRGMVKILQTDILLKKEEQDLQSFGERLKNKIRVIESDYQQAMGRLSRAEKTLNLKKGLLQSTEAQVIEIRTQNITVESEMSALCKKNALKGIVEVQGILNMNLDEDQERLEIEKYRTDLLSLKARQKAIQKQMGKTLYQESEHLKLKEEYHEVKSSLNQIQQQLSSKQHVLLQYQSQLKKKESLEEDFKKLSLRREHVQEISNLLRGNGFINFISSIYLQNLCKSANTRFQKLTNNQLSLELGDANEFMVRDHLNEGKLRLLKTLSGGQIFQASLSLALSLAENVTQLNKAEQGFFFLDEGFGSLDRDSLLLVFDSLKSLQKENRIVGIISHVEELQLEIDTYLSVKQDPERGSLISKSWEEAEPQKI